MVTTQACLALQHLKHFSGPTKNTIIPSNPTSTLLFLREVMTFSQTSFLSMLMAYLHVGSQEVCHF